MGQLLLAFHLSVGFLLIALTFLLACLLRIVNCIGGTPRKPRLVWGPTPIISIKYMSQAMRNAEYQSDTIVYDVYKINSVEDFDLHLDDFTPKILPQSARRIWKRLLGDYFVFLYALLKYDIFFYFFDGGFLTRTPYRCLELQFLRIARKKSIVMPYGSDSFVYSRIRNLELRHALLRCYPNLAKMEHKISRQIDYFCRNADFVMGCMVHVECLPRWDMLPVLYYPIDTDKWSSNRKKNQADGVNGEVIVAHTPNHKGFKGTEILIQACKELVSEGLNVRLMLIENRPNKEVRLLLEQCDILAEQFVVGYALSAVEGMALGLPVLSNIEIDVIHQLFRKHSYLDECPIVSVNYYTFKEKLRELVISPGLREELGRQGRAYVEKHHSFGSNIKMWNEVIEKVWYDKDIDLMTYYDKSRSAIQPVKYLSKDD
ncbi:hypothetical protein GTO91_07270 [Heliobacterium undosum]|uniref:Glycosyltransferase n=1 Tax=Heliomicrobium undosum TaxID=121734 RepID=A0A845L3B2_9FIRM|nr:glycosyltransferase family 4 protein [Heliomicrobium undosum]MZP29505.1 hypothetical protein [Heliomicrobium undosum]